MDLASLMHRTADGTYRGEGACAMFRKIALTRVKQQLNTGHSLGTGAQRALSRQQAARGGGLAKKTKR